MAAVTEVDVIVRAQAVCVGLGFAQAIAGDFSLQPTPNATAIFQVSYRGDTPNGQIGGFEEARGTVVVTVQRLINNAHDATKRQLHTDARAILAGLVRDGATDGQYAVDDAGQSQEISQPRGAAYLMLTLRVPVNFEAAL